MTRQSFLTGLFNLVAVVLCAVAAVAVVLTVHWLLNRAWPDAGVHAKLAFGLVAPAGVVLFGLLVERAGGLVERVAAGH
jgi:hypothetical protein